MFRLRFSRNAKKTHAGQNILEVSFTGSEKKQLNKPLKLVVAKNFFPSAYVISRTCFDLCFLLHVLTGRHYFLWNFIVILSFFQPPCCRFLETNVLRKDIILCYLHNANTKLLQIKLSCMIMIVKSSKLILFFE